MNLRTYLMIKQANEAVKRDTGTGLGTPRSFAPIFGSDTGLWPSWYKKKRVLPGGVLMGTTPWGTPFTVDGPPIVINSKNTTNSNNGVLSDSAKRQLSRLNASTIGITGGSL